MPIQASEAGVGFIVWGSRRQEMHRGLHDIPEKGLQIWFESAFCVDSACRHMAFCRSI
ncbi:hypothetical protein GCM10027217_05560 [Pseudomaricurvus hydrocarbonicus]